MDVNAVVDLANGDVLITPFEGTYSNVQYNNGVWNACSFDDMSQHFVMLDDTLYSVTPDGTNPIISQLASTSKLLVETYDEQGLLTLSIYDMDGRFVSKLHILLNVSVMLLIQTVGWKQLFGKKYLINKSL